MRGRKPNPAQSNVLRGTFRPDRQHHGARVEIGLPVCPKWMPKEAKRYWRAIGPELVRVGLIGKTDQAPFVLYCDSLAKYEQVTRQLQEASDLLDETPQGFLVQSALFTIRNKLWEQLLKASQEFGLSPAARSRVKDGGQESLPLGDWDEL